jgi:two-component system, chemotaxis family, protein-glutamate methylesterase/glutaminase
MGYDLVAIGASWGGFAALQAVLGALDRDFGAAVVVAQHRSAQGDDTLLSSLLARTVAVAISDAHDKEELRPGTVLVAPPDYHLLVEDGCVSLSCDEPVRFSRPSIDVMFDSASDAYGDRVVGVVLTGANADGSQGLARIRRRGGHAIVQDPETAERPEMPRAARAAVPDAHVLALGEIGPRLNEIVGSVPA